VAPEPRLLSTHFFSPALARNTAIYRLAAVGLVVGVILIFDFATRQVYLGFKNKSSFPSHSSSPAQKSYRPEHRCPHPVYHHGFVPNSSGTDVFGSTQTTYFINSVGFRDAKIRSVDHRTPQKRVLLMGDSFAEGIGVPWEETLAGRLSSSLAAEGVEVLNGAVASYSPSLISAKLGYLFDQEKLRADLVVVFIDISDLEDELNLVAEPEGGFTTKKSSPFDDPRYVTWDQKFCVWLEKGPEANFTLLGPLTRKLRQLWRQAGSPGGTPELKRASWPEYHGKADALILEGLEKERKSMDQIARMTKDHGSRLLVVIYPWLEQVDAGISPSRPEKIWGEWCRAEGVALLNLFPVFVPMGKNYEKKYCLSGDGHWNSEGHRVVAQALMAKLKDLMMEKEERKN